MELRQVNPNNVIQDDIVVNPSYNFIESNTLVMDYCEIKERHIIPTFSRDNESLLSHTDFIDAVAEAAQFVYPTFNLNAPAIRVSHPITGRIPDAKGKAVKDLEEHEKTLYFERMAFVIEFPGITEVIDGNTLCLVVGGIKAFNQDNLNSRKTHEHFKVFIGFQNKVCTNLCIWTDGIKDDLRASSHQQLYKQLVDLFLSYNADKQLERMRWMSQFALNESQFAQLIGRCRLYHHLPAAEKLYIPELKLTDTQVSIISRDYYADESFARDNTGAINLWKLYNLLTGANKSSYIDRFLERNHNAFEFSDTIASAIECKEPCWYLS